MLCWPWLLFDDIVKSHHRTHGWTFYDFILFKHENKQCVLASGIVPAAFRVRIWASISGLLVCPSLFFHLYGNNVRGMLMRKLHMRGASRSMARLMSVLFAVQIVVGGFCLMSADVHAMPQAMASVDMQAHCAKQALSDADHQQSDDQQRSDHHSDNCYHCDQPDQLSTASGSFSAPVALLLPDMVAQPAAPLLHSVKTGLFSARTPTGPPRSSSLLYRQTQRIRV